MSNSASSAGAPVSARHSWFSRPELGAASISQAIAPTKGGVTSEAITSVRTVRRERHVGARHQPAQRRRDQAADRAHRDGDDQRRDQRVDEARIGEQRDEVAERRAGRPCRRRHRPPASPSAARSSPRSSAAMTAIERSSGAAGRSNASRERRTSCQRTPCMRTTRSVRRTSYLEVPRVLRLDLVGLLLDLGRVLLARS